MPSILWKRLDLEGHDACRIVECDDGWDIAGNAVFDHQGDAANLAYRLNCDRSWLSRKATIGGWIGSRDIHILIERAADGHWYVNGEKNVDFRGLVDIDLGFTPASNTNAIRRMNLEKGRQSESVAVWLDTEDWSVKALPQVYRRLDANTYDYSSPLHEYQAELSVSEFGLVVEYPALWRMINCLSDLEEKGRGTGR
ncbi:putative glycolipid-binding domain-containing protein [Labrys sp. LIt4]|uniref:putative glycolipid-binding domain-containing protein n=1 Tax=Labrys sp. LIt4 TaxID=2821355 RepID=UPI001ADEE0B2|nr:putative glycolipid-binding domain-containing protein [Labrys sp. LIt4]MBP0579557.1 putative glycolipid-binding domain-containing protein [Labrys sp. LIt4]